MVDATSLGKNSVINIMNKKDPSPAMPASEKTPLVSVIMNCLNCEEYLKDAINSVYAQIYSNWEIVFWDNASCDRSAAIAQSYDYRLRYFKGEKTIPLGAARNRALKQARGEFIAFLDCDDFWMPTKLEKQIPLFLKTQSLGLVICDTINFNMRGESSRRYGRKKPPMGNVFKKLLIKNFISISTTVLRRKALDNLEWFDEQFNMSEEADLFLRIAYLWELGYVDEVLAKRRVHNKSWTLSNKGLYPKEHEEILRKLCSSLHNFELNYHQEIAKNKTNIAIEYAFLDWEKGLNKEARKRLRPFLFSGGVKNNVIYFLTYFPYPLARSVRLLWRRVAGIRPI